MQPSIYGGQETLREAFRLSQFSSSLEDQQSSAPPTKLLVFSAITIPTPGTHSVSVRWPLSQSCLVTGEVFKGVIKLKPLTKSEGQSILGGYC